MLRTTALREGFPLQPWGHLLRNICGMAMEKEDTGLSIRLAESMLTIDEATDTRTRLTSFHWVPL